MMLRLMTWHRLLRLKDVCSASNHFTTVGTYGRPRCMPEKIVRCLSKSTNGVEDAKPQHSSDFSQPRSTVKVLYDGECNICMHEIRLLKRITGRRPVDFVDITTPQFSEDKFGGVTYEMAMKEMTVIGTDGKVHVQADAVHEMYRACGFGWLATLTRLPGLETAFNTLYMQFAAYRLKAALDRCDSGVSCSVKLKHLRDKLRPPRDQV